MRIEVKLTVDYSTGKLSEEEAFRLLVGRIDEELTESMGRIHLTCGVEGKLEMNGWDADYSNGR